MKSIQHGILLKKLNYSETSLILHFYTLESGFQAYLFQGGKKKKGNILQPLSIVELESYSRPDSDLGKISSISPDPALQSIPYHPIKSGLAFFITELISQCLQSSDSDAQMFGFIKQEILWLDDAEEFTTYPIWFLLKFADFLGFSPNIIQKNSTFFDIEEGELTRYLPKGHAYINDESVPILETILGKSKADILSTPISKSVRKLIINNIISYYKIHISNFKTPKSLEVMQTVFND
ncbi:MAG: DNA repair protein RecO [Brumimicrobium sp.]